MDCFGRTLIRRCASKGWIRLAALSLALLGLPHLHAATGSDNAGNYSLGWSNGDNQGSGFGPWVFENNAHDFPKRIVYSLPSLDSLHAWIEGDDNRVDFKMTRRKQ
jgi:hypothetical protein